MSDAAQNNREVSVDEAECTKARAKGRRQEGMVLGRLQLVGHIPKFIVSTELNFTLALRNNLLTGLLLKTSHSFMHACMQCVCLPLHTCSISHMFMSTHTHTHTKDHVWKSEDNLV